MLFKNGKIKPLTLLLFGALVVAVFLFANSGRLEVVSPDINGYEPYGESVYVGKVRSSLATVEIPSSLALTHTCEAGKLSSWEGKCAYIPVSNQDPDEIANPEHNNIYRSNGDLIGLCSNFGGYEALSAELVEGETYSRYTSFPNRCTHYYVQNYRPVDLDGDGVVNSLDECPEEPASTANGCVEEPVVVPEPSDPVIGSLINIFNALKDWLQSFFDSLPFAIVAADNHLVNTPLDVSVDLTTPSVPDTDFSDGSVTRHYGVVYVADESGDFLYQGTQKEITSGTSYEESFTYTPTQTGKIVAGGVVVSTSASFNYDTLSWNAWSDPVIIANDEKLVTVTGIGAPSEPSNLFGNIFSAIGSFISNLTCSWFGLFCS